MNQKERLYKYFIKLPQPLKLKLVKLFCKFNKKSLQNIDIPLKLILYVTNRCNLKCTHCFYGAYINKDMEKELTLVEIKQIASSLRHKLHQLTLTGGEPTLREDLVSICDLFYKLNKTHMITISTNGYLPKITEETIKNILKRVDLNINVQVSLDGPENIHDKIRGATGAFKRAIDTVNRCKRLKNKFPNLNLICILTVISNQNYNEVYRLANFVRGHLKVFHKFRLLRGSHFSVYVIDRCMLSDFNPYDKQCSLPELSQLEKLYVLLEQLNQPEDYSFLSKLQLLYMRYALDIMHNGEKKISCMAGRHDGVIYPSGDVSMCEMTIPFGNLRDNNLDFFRLWNSEVANQRRRVMKSCFCTHPCNIMTSIIYDERSLISLFLDKPK